MDKRIEQLEAILKNETLAEQIFVGTLDETKKNLEEQGIEFSIEELKALVEGLKDSAVEDDEEEISEEGLEDVVGGASYYERQCYRYGKQLGKAFRKAVGWAISLFV